jgi:hypothetical protein
LGAWFTVDKNLKNWELSSDQMDTSPTHKRGDTFHTDFFMAWDPTVHDLWEEGCLNQMLNCSAGDTGRGKLIHQTWPQTWSADPRLVPVPEKRAVEKDAVVVNEFDWRVLFPVIATAASIALWAGVLWTKPSEKP